MNFLDHYNSELRHLREAGARFAREHPQIASSLGLQPNSTADPFVERLLEGVAFLSARVQTRLDMECAEFARQALCQVCPLYLSATPAMSSFAFHPDFGSPGAFRGRHLPRGTLIRAALPGRARSVTFSTARDVTLLPLRLERAECRRSLGDVSAELARYLTPAQAALRLSFRLEGNTTLKELAEMTGGGKPLHLSLAGDLPRAYALHRTMLVDTSAWYAIAADEQGEALLNLPLDRLRLSATDEGESLLPADPGGLPGLRLLREYFAQPARLLSVEMDALTPLAKKAPLARSFELILALRHPPADLIGEVDAGQFRLFATPAINLYPKRLDPVPYDPNQTEQWIPVDRMRPAEHHLWRLLEVAVCDSNGRSHAARPALDAGGYQSEEAAARYSLRREPALQSESPRQSRPDALGSHDLITISACSSELGLDDIATLTGKALVADRGWRPEDLPAAELSVEGGGAAERVECLWPASAPRAIPDLERCWQAVSHIGLNSLSLRGAERQDICTRLMEMLRLAAKSGAALDRQRIDSLKSASLQACFIAAGRGSPQGLVRGVRAEIDISSVMHADRGAWLFGRLLAQTLAQSLTLNDGIEVRVLLDGELASLHGNTLRADGELQ
ncbi:type VI secretion system baseplate subunit TssF [Chromobacterium sp. ATCC 53434]|uniref:type VI secretion system baseplate subunit TssF n=1 Tax=Chromobacterium sp. (strain ATCC 53434 / SC 14030) TaxID=2059672 RepID=UPI000C778CA3|nr:type VI secretion system baseplate subunit TssF [Chromobacterium sp. ATCC 53434]AUH51022.1 type VI secretion system baseplate subunit TssF [Chromobacterium sp. ATCC 53434]